jgi:hypothetical protein
MPTLGKILIIWGALLPLIALPSIDFGPNGVVPLLSVSLQSVEARIGWVDLSFDRVLVWGLMLIALGLSVCVMSAIDGNRMNNE